MIKVAITGGIGSGKSHIALEIARRGYPIYYADMRAKHLMQEDAALVQAVKTAFGAEVYDSNGNLQRQVLSAKVFGQPDLLAKLNGMVHPVTTADYIAWVLHQESLGKDLCFKEAAIIFETGSYRASDFVVLVVAPETLRLARVHARDGLSHEQIRERMARQWPDEQKIPLADFVITNDGVQDVGLQVDQLFQALAQRFPQLKG